MKDDTVYLKHIVDSINKIHTYAECGREEFRSKTHWQDAIIRNLEIIGEAAKRVSESTRKKNNDIPWRSIAGMRDVLIHDYLGVDLDVVWNVVVNELPLLKKQICEVLEGD